MGKFAIEILSPQGLIFKGEVLSASLPTERGMITVLPGHINLVTKLCNGEIVVNSSISGIKKIAVSSGFVEVTNVGINVVAEFAMQSDAVNKQKIQQAIDLVKIMKDKRKMFIDMSIAGSKFKKSIIELKSGVKYRRKKI
ncbi:MAG: ATP synthase F1 subunit epsilon [Endomicrobium sp.]|jgi:F-type H+-transporting ATPase subunit epsilon|nr:ATP synthase F1 subunit epsilon [Endomicrobium sp.]